MARLTQCFLRRSRRLISSAEKDSGTKSPTHIPDVIVLRVSGVLKCFKEFRKTGRASAVLGRTIPISRHTKLPERFVSKQNFFEKKLVLPSVAKMVLVQ